MIMNRCNIFWVDRGIHTKTRGKTYAPYASSGGKTYTSCASRFWSGYLHQPKKYYTDSLIHVDQLLEGIYTQAMRNKILLQQYCVSSVLWASKELMYILANVQSVKKDDTKLFRVFIEHPSYKFSMIIT